MKRDYQIIIKNGLVIDGLGNQGQTKDIAIEHDRIVLIEKDIPEYKAELVIDASHMVVAPGFIDPHSHTDVELIVNPRAESKIRQGVTTEIAGNCGFTLFPLSFRNFEEKHHYCDNLYGVTITWRTMEEFFDLLEFRGISLNYATLLGHSTLRSCVMGNYARPPSKDEMSEMKSILRECLDKGAFGLSSGLIYVPGCFADKQELIELCREVSAFGGVYSSHIRNESDFLTEAIEETFEIARESMVSLQISHLKLAYPRNWSKIHWVLSRISEEKSSGMEVLADRYPYTATSTLLSTLMPPSVQQGSVQEFLAHLKDPAYEGLLRSFFKAGEDKIGSWENVIISSVASKRNRHLVGKSIAQAAKESNKEPFIFVRDLLIDEENQVWMINFSLNEDNFRRIIRHPLVVVGSDGWARAPYGVLGKDKPHPRSYGTFPRILGKYVREEKVLTLEQAVEKMTSITARKFGLYGRGCLKEGYFADIVIFDPDRVIDRATWTNPHCYPEGIPYVIVNGIPVIYEGEHTGNLPGRVLRKNLLFCL
ncbi:MAG: D-aminoacylase [Syntrophales bacterium]|nr:D-aminoacylase [Syntrophales bacterium]